MDMFFQPKRVDKPWGFEIWFAQTDAYVGKIIHVNKHSQLSLQYHVKKDVVRVQDDYGRSN